MFNENPEHKLILAKIGQNTIILAENKRKSIICIKVKIEELFLWKKA